MKNKIYFQNIDFNPALLIWISTIILTFIFALTPLKMMIYRPINTNEFEYLKIGACKDIPTQKRLLNINLASKFELIQINGIGPVLADRVIQKRIALGEFKNLAQLSSVKGLGIKKTNKIKEQICFKEEKCSVF